MSRKEVCALIREHELGEEVKNRFGDNYTRIPTKKLEELLSEYDLLKEEESCDTKEYFFEDPVQTENEEVVVEDITPTGEISSPYEAACMAFLGVLKDCGLLDSVIAKL